MRILVRIIDVLLRAFITALLCVWLVPVFSGVNTAAFGYGQMVATLIIAYAAELGYAALNEVLTIMLNAQISRYRRQNKELEILIAKLRKGDKDE